ncbi:MAG: radical SAM family heme chaperone HemW [Acidimicrobiales bacterium]|nr:radical SAM family heme chaperone HemW [Acidimicrobiales bacterium]
MTANFGIYLHVPFCSHRCDYCAFATWTDRHHLIEPYLLACKKQAQKISSDVPEITSVFVGGGTPNLVPATELMAIFEDLPLATNVEFTVECNPDRVNEEQMRIYFQSGVTRISMGVQSMVPEVLESLGREHNPENVAAAVGYIRSAGFKKLNLDLIYGAAGETMEQWQKSLELALQLGPDHISAYALTVEAGTPLAEDPGRHPDDDVQADKYVMADEMLSSRHYENYEISNWALADSQCQHNHLYWNQGEYMGLGVAAHSQIAGRRFWSVRTPERFIKAIESGESAEAGGETLNEEDWELEGLQLAIRTSNGVPSDVVPESVAHLVEKAGPGYVRLNRDGRLLANEVAVRIEPYQSKPS